MIRLSYITNEVAQTTNQHLTNTIRNSQGKSSYHFKHSNFVALRFYLFINAFIYTFLQLLYQCFVKFGW